MASLEYEADEGEARSDVDLFEDEDQMSFQQHQPDWSPDYGCEDESEGDERPGSPETPLQYKAGQSSLRQPTLSLSPGPTSKQSIRTPTSRHGSSYSGGKRHLSEEGSLEEVKDMLRLLCEKVDRNEQCLKELQAKSQTPK